MNILVSELDGTPAVALPVEIVERKGLGHPDTICDALAEEASHALSRFYLERFGFVLHHNVDKVMLRGGAARPAFGGGVVDEPIDIYVAGRATHEYRGVGVPVETLVHESARGWLAGHMRGLDTHHVRVHSLVRPGSRDLVELFERQRQGARKLANDTSLGVGFAPLTPLERAVLATERTLQEAAAPERGEDVKVMGVRIGGHSTLTVACAFVGLHLADLHAYLEARERTADMARAAAHAELGAGATVQVNTADDTSPSGSVYLTVTGTSAEAGDDGQTGRGNRANGLITPARPMSLESVAGKNPITHVGKLYNVAATRMAEALVAELADVREAYVQLVSRIGSPIEEPQAVDIRLRVDTPARAAELTPRATAIARAHLDAIGTLWEELITRNLATHDATSR
jgi:S-adenosylmethionine synthetase